MEENDFGIFPWNNYLNLCGGDKGHVWILEHGAVYRCFQISRFINFLPKGRTGCV